MTRINCIPVQELNRRHLTAEYYELPRIFTSVRNLLEKGKDPAEVDMPKEYVLGTGHMKFFYNKLGWLAARYADLHIEMRARGMNPSPIQALLLDLPEHLIQQWEPTKKAMKLNRERIAEREKTMKSTAK